MPPTHPQILQAIPQRQTLREGGHLQKSLISAFPRITKETSANQATHKWPLRV